MSRRTVESPALGWSPVAGRLVFRSPHLSSSADVLASGTRIASAPLADFSMVGPDIWALTLPPIFAASLKGEGELSLVSAPGGEVLVALPIRTADPEGPLRLVDARGRQVVLNKWGRLAPAFALAAPGELPELLALTSRVVADLESFGLSPWIMGGTLLGPIREGRLLPHDDDADIGYLSDHGHPADVALESYSLERFLTRQGYEVLRFGSTQIQLRHEDADTAFHVDVFGAFWRAGVFMQPFHIESPLDRGVFEALTTVDVAGLELPAPNPPEAWLEANYGPGWRTPDPGHRFMTPLRTVRRFHSWFGSTNTQLSYWEELHSASPHSSADPLQPSTAGGRAASSDSRRPIVELGHGRGDDSLLLAATGRELIAVDFSRAAGRLLTSRRGTLRREHSARISVERIDLTDNRRLLDLNVRLLRTASSYDVLSVDLLHVIPAEHRPHLIAAIRRLLGSDGEWYVEFPTAPAADFSHELPCTWHLTTESFQELVAHDGHLTVVALETHADADRPRAVALVTAAKEMDV